MKRPVSIILWAIGIIFGLIILTAAGLILFFPKEKAKELAIKQISSTLNRKVSVGTVSISIWGGLGVYLEGIKIANPVGFEGPDFLTARALDVKVRLLPLFKKDIQIDKLILVKPQIALHKLADGKHNYRFAEAPSPSTGKPPAEEEISDEAKMAAFAISFKNLRVEDGILRYLDDSAGMQIFIKGWGLNSKLDMPRQAAYHTTGTLTIDSLKISSTKSKFPPMQLVFKYDAVIDLKENNIILVNSKLRLNDLDFDVKAGIPNLNTMAFVNLEIGTNRENVEDFVSLLPDAGKALLAPYSMEGDIGFEATVKYGKSSRPQIAYSGKADFYDFVLSKKGIEGRLNLNAARADFRNNYVRFSVEKGSFDGEPLEGYIAISDFENPEIDAKFKGKLNLALLNPFLPKKGEPKISGVMQFDIGALGNIKNPDLFRLSGELAIKDGSFVSNSLPEPVEKFDCEIRMAAKSAEIKNLYIKFPSSEFSLSGIMADPLPGLMPGYKGNGKKPNLTFELKSSRFDADRLFPEAVPGSGVNRAEMPLDSVAPFIVPDINGDGKGAIDTLIYSKVEFTKITADISIKDRKIYISNANGNVYTGKVTGETEIDLNDFKNPKYTGKFLATQIEANDFLTRFVGFGGHLFGKLNMNGNFSTTGWEPEPMLKSLTMDGMAVFNEAKLVNFELLERLAENLHLKTFKEETLKDAATAFRVENGRVVFDGMRFLSNIGDWNIKGSIGFDGTLNYIGEVLLSNAVSNQILSQSGMVSSLAGLFQESSTGQIRVPFRLGGSYSNPKIGIDMSVKDKVKDNIKDKLDNALQDLLQQK
jgi:hypothetical protein